MMTRRTRVTALVYAIVCGVLFASVASASTTLDAPDGAARSLYQSWIDAARVPTADATVVLHLRDCDEGHMTCMVWRRGGPQIYFPDLSYLWTEPDRSPSDQVLVMSTFLHELGHVWDYYASRRSLVRASFMRIMRLESGWWSWIRGVPPGEQLGDAYSYCAQGVYPDQSSYEGYRAYHPTRRQHQRVCALIQAAG